VWKPKKDQGNIRGSSPTSGSNVVNGYIVLNSGGITSATSGTGGSGTR